MADVYDLTTAMGRALAARDARALVNAPEAEKYLNAADLLDTERRRDASWCGNPRCLCADEWPICEEWMSVGRASSVFGPKWRLCARCGNPLAVHPPDPEVARA